MLKNLTMLFFLCYNSMACSGQTFNTGICNNKTLGDMYRLVFIWGLLLR
jgi:hypothetical protein